MAFRDWVLGVLTAPGSVISSRPFSGQGEEIGFFLKEKIHFKFILIVKQIQDDRVFNDPLCLICFFPFLKTPYNDSLASSLIQSSNNTNTSISKMIIENT